MVDTMFDATTGEGLQRQAVLAWRARLPWRAAKAGRLFRWISAIGWACMRLASPEPEKAISHLRVYEAALADAVAGLP